MFHDPHINVLYTLTIEQSIFFNPNLTDLRLNNKREVILDCPSCGPPYERKIFQIIAFMTLTLTFFILGQLDKWFF